MLHITFWGFMGLVIESVFLGLEKGGWIIPEKKHHLLPLSQESRLSAFKVEVEKRITMGEGGRLHPLAKERSEF